MELGAFIVLYLVVLGLQPDLTPAPTLNLSAAHLLACLFVCFTSHLQAQPLSQPLSQYQLWSLRSSSCVTGRGMMVHPLELLLLTELTVDSPLSIDDDLKALTSIHSVLSFLRYSAAPKIPRGARPLFVKHVENIIESVSLSRSIHT